MMMMQGLHKKIPTTCIWQENVNKEVRKKGKRKENNNNNNKKMKHGLSGSVGCAVRLETMRSWVQPPPRSATFFC